MFSWLMRSGSAAPGDQADAAAASSARALARAEAASKRGIERLDAGDAESACSAFREAIEAAPDVAAHHVNLAYSLQESGHDDDSGAPLQRAAALDATSVDAWYMLGEWSERQHEVAEATSCFARALELKPEFEAAWVGWSRVLAQGEDRAAAIAALERAKSRFPENVDLDLYRGNVALADDDAAGAVEAYERVIARRPGDVTVMANLGLALQAAGRVAEAIGVLNEAVAIDPSVATAHFHLGRVLTGDKQHPAAEAALLRAMALQPDDAETLNAYGNVLQATGRMRLAADAFRRVIELRPDMPGGYANLGLAVYEMGDASAAADLLRRGLAIKPVAEMHDNLGIALQRLGHVDEAIEHYRAAIELKPESVNTRCNLASALADGSQASASIAAYRQILSHHPDHFVAHSNLLYNLSFDSACSPEDYLAEARRFDARVSARVTEIVFPTPAPARAKTPLRVGFVSGDLRTHPVGHFVEGILHHLDRDRFELYAYSTAVNEDALTERIRPLFAGWRSLKGTSDVDAARGIRDDLVDILIDLSGHTGDNRLPMFALRPATVQVSWLGYFASTGLSAIDYIIADEHCVPLGAEAAFSEKVWRVAETRLCFTPPLPGAMPEVALSPAARNGYVTFGCFQRLPKVTNAVLELWGRVFAGLPTARLLLQSQQTARKVFVDEILGRLADVGIAADRVDIRQPARRNDYLHSYDHVDIVLDTFPYTGGTTTVEAMLMGVPTVTLAGMSMIGRQGVALLSAAGLDEWVASSPAEYVDKAVTFATDYEALSRLRWAPRERVIHSPLCDVQGFAKRFGSALEAMWLQAVTSSA